MMSSAKRNYQRWNNSSSAAGAFESLLTKPAAPLAFLQPWKGANTAKRVQGGWSVEHSSVQGTFLTRTLMTWETKSLHPESASSRTLTVPGAFLLTHIGLVLYSNLVEMFSHLGGKVTGFPWHSLFWLLKIIRRLLGMGTLWKAVLDKFWGLVCFQTAYLESIFFSPSVVWSCLLAMVPRSSVLLPQHPRCGRKSWSRLSFAS